MEKEDGGNLTYLGGGRHLVLQSFHGTTPCGHKTKQGNFVGSASVIKWGFVPVNMLTISKISGNRNGVPRTGAADPEPLALNSSETLCQTYWGLKCLIARKKQQSCQEPGDIEWSFTDTQETLLKRVLSIFLASCSWRGLRLPPEWRQNFQSSRDHLFLLHYPAVFLNHTEKVVTSSAWTQRRWENATILAQQALTSFCFKPYFQNLGIQETFLEFSVSNVWRKHVNLLKLPLPL